jgi:glycosyltransferase involved in cell wall biosynthesis
LIMQSSINSIREALGWNINGRFLTQRMTGVQRYAYEIIFALDEILSLNADLNDRLGGMRLILPPGVRTPVLAKIAHCRTRLGRGHAWDQLVLPFYAGNGVLSLGNSGPVLARNSIVCIHDANVFTLPESYSRLFGMAYRTLLPLAGRRAERVATVSQFSADMLVKYGICSREKIFIAPNGHEHALRWNPNEAQLVPNSLPKRPFVLLLGSRARHKNVDIVIDQADGLDAAGIDIVVAGGASNIFSASGSRPPQPNVHEIGYVGDDDLAALYKRALCLVFPSKTEGFGIPLLEAMAWNCPVISSTAASLIEVGGDAVIYVAPGDGGQWRNAIIGLSGNEQLRAEMSAKGRQRINRFSWRRSAQIYLEEIERCSR